MTCLLCCIVLEKIVEISQDSFGTVPALNTEYKNRPDMQTTIKKRSHILFPAVTPLFVAVLTIKSSLLHTSVLEAATLYVKPSAEIVVRTGQGTNFKIVGMVKDGDSVQLVEEGNGYAKVRLENGVEGWMVRRFLGKERPLREVVETLRKENAEIKEKERYTAQNLLEVSETLEQTKSKLADLTTEHEQLQTRHTTLEQDTANVITIKNSLQTTTDENSQLKEQLALLEDENESLKKDKTKNWFLAGAGVLFFGIILGKIQRPSRRRKSSLM